jgi:hypothetical protein
MDSNIYGIEKIEPQTNEGHEFPEILPERFNSTTELSDIPILPERFY